MDEHTNFAVEYKGLTDEQLLQIAGEGGLVEEAAQAIQIEMRSRKLTPAMVENYRAETQRYELARKAEDPNRSQSMFGTGFTILGRAYLSDQDKAQGIQVRTKWFALRGLPLFPVASYRYSCQDVTTGLIQWKEEKVIDQVPLNWKQAGRTWLKTTGLIILSLALLIAFLEWRNSLHAG
jgi:hypothetical protein